jgi:hypothetical protein
VQFYSDAREGVDQVSDEATTNRGVHDDHGMIAIVGFQKLNFRLTHTIT